jgi:hypothetical protein
LGGLRAIWPTLALLPALRVTLGCGVALLEYWSLFEGVHFAFVSGMTIGYGDLAAKATVARILAIAIAIGLIGILPCGLVAAVGLRNALGKLTEWAIALAAAPFLATPALLVSTAVAAADSAAKAACVQVRGVDRRHHSSQSMGSTDMNPTRQRKKASVSGSVS